MPWLCDILKALLWAVVAAAVSLAFGLAGIGTGPMPIIVPMVIAPVLAAHYHQSRRITVLVVIWILVLVGIAIGLLLWDLRNFHFRSVQG